MKLIMENWNQFLNEEEDTLEEGIPQLAGLIGSIVGGGGAQPTGPVDVSTPGIEQAAERGAQLELNKLYSNNDGSHTIKIKVDLGVTHPMIRDIGGSRAKTALMAAVKGENVRGTVTDSQVSLQPVNDDDFTKGTYIILTGTVK